MEHSTTKSSPALRAAMEGSDGPPAVCVLCGKRCREQDGAAWVQFSLDPLALRSPRGGTLDPADMSRTDWFCARHVDAARELWFLPRHEAIERLRGIGLRHWWSRLQRWWGRKQHGPLVRSAAGELEFRFGPGQKMAAIRNRLVARHGVRVDAGLRDHQPGDLRLELSGQWLVLHEDPAAGVCLFAEVPSSEPVLRRVAERWLRDARS